LAVAQSKSNIKIYFGDPHTGAAQRVNKLNRSQPVGTVTQVLTPRLNNAQTDLDLFVDLSSRFDGAIEDLQSVVAIAGDTPVMRKDFLVSRYQVREARLAGASGVLLIAAMLEADQLEAMLEAAFELDMFVLVEVFDLPDLDKCLPILERAGSALDDDRCRYLLGVNCRDLRTLQVDFAHFARMVDALPDTIPLVAESGLTDPAQATELAQLGYRAALVGTALMRSGDATAAIGRIRELGTAGLAKCT